MDIMIKWLFEQMGMVIIMGVVIYWLQSRLIKSEEEKDKLSQEVIKLTTLWENKAKSLDEEENEFNEKILNLLNEIKGMLSKNK